MTSPDSDISVVVPFYNEADNVRFVLEELRSVLPQAEIIAIDDGSSDQTWPQVQSVAGVRRLRLGRNLGQSALFATAFVRVEMTKLSSLIHYGRRQRMDTFRI